MQAGGHGAPETLYLRPSVVGAMQELSNLEKRVLLALGAVGESATPEQIQEKGGFGELVQVMNASSWLQAKGLVRHEETMRVFIGLGKEGEAAVRDGLPERKVVKLLVEAGGGMMLPQLQDHPALAKGEINVATGWLKKKGLANIEKQPWGGGLGEPRVGVTPTACTALVLTERGRAVAAGDATEDERVLQQVAQGEVLASDVDQVGLALLLQRQNVVRRREAITRIIHLTKKGHLHYSRARNHLECAEGGM